MIAGIVYLIVVRLWAKTGILGWSPQRVAGIIALVIAILYAGLTGFAVPAQRAVLMITVAMLAVIRQRNTRPFHVLAVALFAVLLIDPLVVLSIGFWLSFTAVSLIIYVLAGRLAKPDFILGSLKINGVTSVGLAPILLLFFQQISCVAPFANLLIVPIMSFIIVPLALCATFLLFIAPLLASKLFFCLDLALQAVWWVLLKLSELPLATLNHPQPSWWTLILTVPAILILFAPRGLPSRWLGLVLLLPLIFTEPSKVSLGTVKMTLLDVGQGLSVLVQTATHLLVFDTGAKFSATSDMGQSVLLPFMREQGIDRIDKLIVSHGDNDHIGGVDSLLAGSTVGEILTSVPEQLSKYSTHDCHAGQAWVWDKVTFSILSPPQSHLFISDNDNSCVLQIQTQETSVLLTGDIEATAELWLTKRYQNKLKSTVMIAPHHGSKTSSTGVFLNAVKPELILIPAGYRNQFGHPHTDVLERYNNANITWLDSARNGAIEVIVKQKLAIESWRQAEGKYWNYNE